MGKITIKAHRVTHRADSQTAAIRYNDRIARQARSLDFTRMSSMAGKGKKKKAETVFLVCEETGNYNYVMRRKPGGEKLELKKYCPELRKRTVHKEKKK